MLSGGSNASWSVTSDASTVTVTFSAPLKSLSGLIVKVVGPPVTAYVCEPLEEPTTVNGVVVRLTGSENVTSMFVFVGTCPVPLVGFVLETLGATSGGM